MPVVAAERQAAEAYFADMTPVIDEDYQGSQWFERVMAEWMKKYLTTNLSTSRQAWDALGQVLQQAVPKEQEILRGYEAITPPDALKAAHAALLENNRKGTAWMQEFVAAIKANHPIEELMSMANSGPPGPSNGEVLAEFRDAAARVGIELPTKLVDAYSDDGDSGTIM